MHFKLYAHHINSSRSLSISSPSLSQFLSLYYFYFTIIIIRLCSILSIVTPDHRYPFRLIWNT
ncbi:hypothetical protein HanXRQr2_Chr17g0825481 [Helianthus annuus]|uniref:Uncharacterized protein n=1 Tax=Helianthus annuus TaxID=4232 RepID=A0A9K3DMG6_HELAN|nr:hypothetical protein HanXRQr2_Chr17g0825481 [Helianthus annuus]